MKNISNISKISGDLGNTIPNPKAKKYSRSRRYCLTWNNYTEEDFKNIEEYCKKNATFHILGREIGEKSQISHIQGYIEFKNQKCFSVLKKAFPKCSWRVANGSKKQNIVYCGKDGNVSKTLTFQEKINQRILENEYNNGKIEWKPWQKFIMNLIKKPATNSRDIHWLWEKKGNVGKSWLCKYITMHNNVVIADGKKDNIFNQIKRSMDEEKIPEIILLDIPRTSVNFVNYGAIEQLKTGLIYSGKYEGGTCIFPWPHIICFANEPPQKDKVSLDRWLIQNITPKNRCNEIERSPSYPEDLPPDFHLEYLIPNRSHNDPY